MCKNKTAEAKINQQSSKTLKINGPTRKVYMQKQHAAKTSCFTAINNFQKLKIISYFLITIHDK